LDVRRFGPGHRRPDGPRGTKGIASQVIWSDDRAHVSELAFSHRGLIPPHSNPNTALFIVVSGGGWVQVGEDRTRVNHGEAVVWPAGVAHGAWTEGSEMRAIVLELRDRPESSALIEGSARPGSQGPAASEARGELAERPPRPEEHDESEGEPW
jgi:quercetin dioxygenase-like cupin family protein